MPASPLPPALVELVLSGARDIARVPTALDAELTLSTLLGGGYAALEPDRGPAFETLARDLCTAASATDSTPARVVAAILGGTPTDAAPWGAALGTVRPTGGWAYGDRYGDQTGYVATFAYHDEPLGGPEHAVVFLVDHTVGLVTDLVVIAPAAALLDQLGVDDDEMTWHAPLAPASVRAAASADPRATAPADGLPPAASRGAPLYPAGAPPPPLPAHAHPPAPPPRPPPP